MKAIPKLFLLVFTFMLLLTGCAKNNTQASPDNQEQSSDSISLICSISQDDEFGGVYINTTSEEFLDAGFCYGDSCKVEFSNGFGFEDIPFYNGYYGKTNDPVIVDYQGYDYVCIAYCLGEPMWDFLQCTENDTVTITLTEREKYLSVQNTMSMVYSDDRADYNSDEEFANYRVMNGGNLKKDMFYRGASPVNNEHNRTAITDSLIEDDGIKYILDLADDEDKIDSYQNQVDFASDYFMNLYKDGKIALLSLNAAYQSDEYKSKLVNGLNTMAKNDGPYYIHCTEGKDRTGFVCIVIEAIAGWTYDEILNDYMETYNNYFGITRDTNSEAYNAVYLNRFLDMMLYLTGVDTEYEVERADLHGNAKNYLIGGGMTESEFSALEKIINK